MPDVPGAPPPLPRQYRPLGVRLAVMAFGGALLVTTAAIWFTFPHEVQDTFTPFQKLTVVAMGLGVFAVGFALARCRVDAAEEGLTVVNGYVTRRFAWAEVVDVTLRPGNPWAVLDLADGTSQSALGIQGSDGTRAQRQVRELRLLVEAHAGHEPPARRDPEAGSGDDPGDDPVS